MLACLENTIIKYAFYLFQLIHIFVTCLNSLRKISEDVMELYRK